MWQESLSDYFVQSIILTQSIFWMWLHDKPINIPDKLNKSFYELSFIFIWFIWIKNIKVGYYSTYLIIQYVIYTILAVFLFNTRYDFKKAICLGFLTVFLNSYYWELPLHLAEILSGSLHIGMLVQLCRLLPVPFLLNKYKFQSNAKAILSLGLGLSTIIMISRFILNLRLPWYHIYILNRLICLLLLVKVVTEAKPTHINLNIIKHNKLVLNSERTVDK